jgi:hypothetical protein
MLIKQSSPTQEKKMAYVIVIQAPACAPVVYGPEPDRTVAEAVMAKLLTEDEGLTGVVNYLNPMGAALQIGASL